MGHQLRYARGSTAGQDPALQSDALSAAGCSRVYLDITSGSWDDGPQPAALLVEQLLTDLEGPPAGAP